MVHNEIRRLSAKEIIESFPEGKEILEREIAVASEQIKKIEKYLKTLYLDESQSEDIKSFITHFVDVFFYKKLYDNYRRMRRELAMYDPPRNTLNVEAAKAVPIEDVHEFAKARISSTRIHANCPFHDEKHPSFVIYRKTNSFHCFSCKKSGDVITFIQKMFGLNFVESVKYLLSCGGRT